MSENNEDAKLTLYTTMKPRIIPDDVCERVLAEVEEIARDNDLTPMIIFGRGSSFHGGWTEKSDIDLMVVFKQNIQDYLFNNFKESSLNRCINIYTDKSYTFEIKFMDITKLVKSVYYKFDYNTLDLFMSEPFKVYPQYSDLYIKLLNEVKELMKVPTYRNTFISQNLRLAKTLLLGDTTSYKTLYLILLRLYRLNVTLGDDLEKFNVGYLYNRLAEGNLNEVSFPGCSDEPSRELYICLLSACTGSVNDTSTLNMRTRVLYDNKELINELILMSLSVIGVDSPIKTSSHAIKSKLPEYIGYIL